MDKDNVIDNEKVHISSHISPSYIKKPFPVVIHSPTHTPTPTPTHTHTPTPTPMCSPTCHGMFDNVI